MCDRMAEVYLRDFPFFNFFLNRGKNRQCPNERGLVHPNSSAPGGSEETWIQRPPILVGAINGFGDSPGGTHVGPVVVSDD